MALILKARGLLHVDVLRQESMKESITDINVTQRPTARDRERKNKLDYHRLDDGAEGITIVNPM
jgi:hypothetical protein